MAFIRSIATIGAFTMLSRVTGIARDILIAGTLGAGTVADAFFVAFKFPNLFRRLFAEGAFAAAFVPLFSATLEKEGQEQAKLFVERSYTVLALALAALTAVMMIVMPWAMYVFAPGFGEVPGKRELAVELARVTFPYLLFISLCSLLSGVLNSLGRFAVAAATPILLNLTLMAALLGLSQFTETPGHALAWGVAAAGVIQFAWLMRAVRRLGYRPRLVRPTLSPRVRTLVRRILPVAFGAGLYQINLLIDTMLASLVSDGAVSYLYYADRVNQLPLGIVGIAIGTALLPLLSRQIAAHDAAGAMESQNRAIEFGMLLTLPAMAGIMVLARPIIEVLFQRGMFSEADTVATAGALAAFSVGLPAYVLVKVLSPGFFARADTRTPVQVAAVALITNIGLNLVLMQVLAHVGIALATALSSCLNAGLLLLLLVRRGYFVWDGRLRHRLPRIVTASLVMAALVGCADWASHRWLLVSDSTSWMAPLLLACSIVLALATYFGAAVALGAMRWKDIRRLKRPK
jgi:putative peptidoglycan lipid II flippase